MLNCGPNKGWHFKLLTLEGLIGSKAAEYTMLLPDENWLSDRLFPHHLLCIKSIERITRKPLSKAVNLTTLERELLERHASMAILPKSRKEIDYNDINDRNWYAKWLLTKFDSSK